MADPQDHEGHTPPAKKTPAKKAAAKKVPATKAPAKKAPATKAPAQKVQPAPLPATHRAGEPAKREVFGRGHALPISLALAGAGLAALVVGRLMRNVTGGS